MIALFTDFGWADPYVGQVHAVLRAAAPSVPVIDLFHAVAPFNVQAAAYLLPAYARSLPPGTVFVCVVDPEVGSARPAVTVRADQHWFVGPDNGLFVPLARRAQSLEVWQIEWRPAQLSATFHGRDLFAPAAAALARGARLSGARTRLQCEPAWPEDLARIVHIDRYGNAITGLRACALAATEMTVRGRSLPRAHHFDEHRPGTLFWYENSSGLAEIAATRASAAALLGLALNDEVTLR